MREHSLRGGSSSNLYASNPKDSPSASGPRLAQGVLHSPVALLCRPASLSAVHLRGRALLQGCADPGPGTGVSARVKLASERETLVGFRPGHTLHAVRGRTLGDSARRDADTVRCARIGNLFQTRAVASILGAQLAELGHHSLYASPAALQERFIAELLTQSQAIELHVADELAAGGVVVETS